MTDDSTIFVCTHCGQTFPPAKPWILPTTAGEKRLCPADARELLDLESLAHQPVGELHPAAEKEAEAHGEASQISAASEEDFSQEPPQDSETFI